MKIAIDWLKQLGTPEWDRGSGVVVDNSNNYVYATGYTSGTFSGNSSKDRTAWIAKFYAKSGERIWLQEFSPSNSQSSRGIAVDNNGAYVALDVLDGQEGQSKTVSWIVKFDLNTGTPEWTYNFQSSNEASSYLHSILADDRGHLYVTGHIYNGSMFSKTGEAIASAGGTDAWIAKLTTDGKLVWLVQLGSNGDDRCNSVAVDGSGNVYAAGCTTGVMPDTNASNSSGMYDGWIAKYDPHSNRQWIIQLGSQQDAEDRGVGVVVDDSGGVYAMGFTAGDFKDSSASESLNFRTWVAKFRASSGEQVWIEQLQTESVDHFARGYSISVDNHSGVYIAGHTNGKLYSEAPARTGIEDFDAWIAKYHANTGKQVWIEQITSSGSETHDRAYSIAIDPSGGLYVTGYTSGSMSEIATQKGSGDIWLARVREVPEDFDELAQVLKRYIADRALPLTQTEEVTATSSTSSQNGNWGAISNLLGISE